MSIIRVDGPARLFVGPMACACDSTFNAAQSWSPGGSDTTFKELGVTENGVQISFNTPMHRVNSDDCGGNEGFPAEWIMMGASATIRGVLTRYSEDITALSKVMSGVYAERDTLPDGTTLLPGTPYFGSGYGFSLLVIGFATRHFFPKCEMATQPREFNISSTERKTSFSVQAYPVYTTGLCDGVETNAGVVYRRYSGGDVVVPECKPKAYGGSAGVPQGIDNFSSTTNNNNNNNNNNGDSNEQL